MITEKSAKTSIIVLLIFGAVFHFIIELRILNDSLSVDARAIIDTLEMCVLVAISVVMIVLLAIEDKEKAKPKKKKQEEK